MSSEKIAIVLDTNILRGNEKTKERLDVFSIELYDETINMIERNDLVEKVALFMPEIVFLELSRYISKKLKSRLDVLRKISYETETIEDIQIEISGTFNETNHIAHIKDSKAKEINLIIIPKAKDELFEKTLNMAINKIPPFQEGESDKGFKDAVLILSMIDFAKENDYSKFVLFSEDKAFKNAEKKISRFFIDETSKKLEIRTGKDVQSYISDIYGLFIEFKEFLRYKFYDDLEATIREKHKIVIDDKGECELEEFNISSERTFVEELMEDEYKLTVGFDITCKDKEGDKTKIGDLNKIFYFLKSEDEWKMEREEDFSYKIF